jgi:hypothetical protein
MRDKASYTLTTTQDASLQNYFFVDPSNGTLSLRDGLKRGPAYVAPNPAAVRLRRSTRPAAR